MGTRVNTPSIDEVGCCGNKDPMLSLVEVICGCPVTMDPDKNPFQKRPEDLSENTWYLVCWEQIGVLEAGFWRAKGEPRPMIFPDLPIICLEIIRVFRDRNDRETDWMMLEYNITNVPNQVKETFSICRIWRDPKNHAQATGILPNSDIFSGGDFLELLDLEVPLFPAMN